MIEKEKRVMSEETIIRTSREHPQVISDSRYRHSAFGDGKAFEGKKKRLPAMGWNSWNAFGSGHTEELTKAMADRFIELGLDKAGYRYIVLDDGCYKAERVDGRLSNEEKKFPSGFKALADYIHGKGLKFGMYNDIGTNLCAGSAVGTCGFEDRDAESYVQWDIDFLKVDNCYYLWDNATFSDGKNARFTSAPAIKGIKLVSEDGTEVLFNAVKDGKLTGRHGFAEGDAVKGIGTFDGTNIGTTPVGDQSSELVFDLKTVKEGGCRLFVTYATSQEPTQGEWLQVAVGEKGSETYAFDGLLTPTEDKDTFRESFVAEITVTEGSVLRLMNHRRQENTLCSYAAMYNALKAADSKKDILLSICEWGKTMPGDWGYKVGDSWRILNDITFQVGRDGDPGAANWVFNGTQSIATQYDKAVIMDEKSGLGKGWNDPDMMVIGMAGIDDTMAKTHFTMWSMMNSPLMLGLDLRNVEKGDATWKIITNRDIIALNQDELGIQAKSVWSSACADNADTTYLMNHDRVDILAKPLSNGDFAVSFINLDDKKACGEFKIDVSDIVSKLGNKLENADKIKQSKEFTLKDLWTGEEKTVGTGICVSDIEAHDNVTFRVSVAKQSD